MPAVPLALAEIEQRLEEIRYLLNRRCLISVLAPAVGVLLGLSGLLVWSASRATPAAFSLALYAAFTLAAVLLAWSALVLWRRWLSLEDVARLADQRGGMRQRLETAVWLAHAGVQPMLAPVLVADTLDRRAAWHAAAVVPRRLPIELAYPAAGLLALATAVFFARLTPPQPEPERIAQPAKPPHPIEPGEVQVPAPPASDARKFWSEPLLAADADSEPGESGAERTGGGGEDDSGPLSQQLRGAIRATLERFDLTDQTHDLAKVGSAGPGGLGPQNLAAGRHEPFGAEPDRTRPHPDLEKQPLPSGEKDDEAGDSGVTATEKKAGEDAQENIARGAQPPQGPNDRPRDPRRAGEGDAYKPEKKDRDVASMPGRDKQPQTQEGKGTNGTESDEHADPNKPKSQLAKPGQPREGSNDSASRNLDGQGTKQGGSRPVAGPGTDPDGLFAPKGSAGTQVAHAPSSGTFKLTLGSFLAVGPGGQEKPKSRDRAPSQSGRAAVAEPPALNPNQTDDDALRRADIPPEYEEIVRRIYSARPAK